MHSTDATRMNRAAYRSLKYLQIQGRLKLDIYIHIYYKHLLLEVVVVRYTYTYIVDDRSMKRSDLYKFYVKSSTQYT